MKKNKKKNGLKQGFKKNGLKEDFKMKEYKQNGLKEEFKMKNYTMNGLTVCEASGGIEVLIMHNENSCVGRVWVPLYYDNKAMKDITQLIGTAYGNSHVDVSRINYRGFINDFSINQDEQGIYVISHGDGLFAQIYLGGTSDLNNHIVLAIAEILYRIWQ